MTVHVFTSAKGSPGVTSTVLALAGVWPAVAGRRVLVMDADLSGSGILPGYLRAATPPGQGLLQLAAGRPAVVGSSWIDAALRLDQAGDVLLLTGVTDPAQATALSALWSPLTSVLGDLDADGIDVLIDVGRVSSASLADPIWTAADVRVWVTRSTLAALASLVPVLDQTRRAGHSSQVLVVGTGRPYSTSEVANALQTTDPLLEVAWDPPAASTFSDGASPGWRHDRTALMRSARAVARQLSTPSEAQTPSAAPAHEPHTLTDSAAVVMAP